MTALPPFLDVHPHGVHVVDTAFQRDHFDASYLLVENGRAAFIDTGTNHAVRRLLRSLSALGLQPGDPVLRVMRVYYAADGRAVEAVFVRYHPEHYRYSIELHAGR